MTPPSTQNTSHPACLAPPPSLWGRGPEDEARRPQQRPIIERSQERRPGPRSRCLALQQIIQLGSDAGVIENAKPASHSGAIGIDQEVLRLRGRSQLGSLGVMRGVIDIENDKLNPTRVRFLQPTHGRLIAATGRSPRCPGLIESKAGHARLGDHLRRRRLG